MLAFDSEREGVRDRFIVNFYLTRFKSLSGIDDELFSEGFPLFVLLIMTYYKKGAGKRDWVTPNTPPLVNSTSLVTF